MQIKPFLVFSLLVLGISANAHSKLKSSSYIVTKTNDTIYGKIKVNYLIGGLKLVTADSTYKIDPNTYTAYYDAKHSAVYRSKVLPSLIPPALAKKFTIPEKAEWLKCIEDGKIALYELKNFSYGYQLDNVLGVSTTLSAIIATGGVPNVEFTNWYIEKEGTQLLPIKYNSFASTGSKSRKERKAVLTELIADNEKVAGSYDQNKAFSFKTVRSLVQQYNSSKS